MVKAKTPNTTTPSEAPVSVLIGCTEHGQTVEMVVARWAQVPGLDPERAKDLTCCAHCSGPAKYEGVSGLTFAELRNVVALCTRCVPKETTE